jgi:hypothetical protein
MSSDGAFTWWSFYHCRHLQVEKVESKPKWLLANSLFNMRKKENESRDYFDSENVGNIKLCSDLSMIDAAELLLLLTEQIFQNHRKRYCLGLRWYEVTKCKVCLLNIQSWSMCLCYMPLKL